MLLFDAPILEYIIGREVPDEMMPDIDECSLTGWILESEILKFSTDEMKEYVGRMRSDAG
jgi:hypothetical protein